MKTLPGILSALRGATVVLSMGSSVVALSGQAFGQSFTGNAAPVSYTHLDVYKRQW